MAKVSLYIYSYLTRLRLLQGIERICGYIAATAVIGSFGTSIQTDHNRSRMKDVKCNLGLIGRMVEKSSVIWKAGAVRYQCLE
jgi:hypothetical protein